MFQKEEIYIKISILNRNFGHRIIRYHIARKLKIQEITKYENILSKIRQTQFTHSVI